MNNIDVYVGNFGTYPIPIGILKKAAFINKGKSLKDQRTKGAKYLLLWGQYQDVNQKTITN